jgi:hypothetical protein
MGYFDEFCRRTDCKVTVQVPGRSISVEPLDASDAAWDLFQDTVDEIEDELGGDPDFEVRPHVQHMRGLPGRRKVYDVVWVTKVA